MRVPAAMDQHLTNSLDELVEHELRKFKRKLYHIALKKCYKPIPWGKLEPAHCDDLAQMLVKYYGEKYALEVTLKVLKAIHQQDVANLLLKKIQQEGSDENEDDKDESDEGESDEDETDDDEEDESDEDDETDDDEEEE
ncbi:calsequestrin-1-like [Trichosurus vulpecula]|uniref:calsequestrin-1-like n=1 Tax=Trichosurus vulpecula TaxID=9337 RepID=UPI00186B46D7|nr:calsequestrin-1-like [Trichosurus vulpecula]